MDQRSVSVFPPWRRVVQAEAISWLNAHRAEPGTSIITSLPDVSEVPPHRFDEWRAWFINAARTVIRWLPGDGVAIFYQSDIRFEGRWVDKGYLVMRAAEEEGAELGWHKIVCRRPPGNIAPGRPSYSHMICVAPKIGAAPSRPGPDVLPDAGHMSWSRAMGEVACRVACRFLRDETATRLVVDPFCGEGSILAMANAFGLAAIGIDLSGKRCKAALQQVIQAP